MANWYSPPLRSGESLNILLFIKYLKSFIVSLKIIIRKNIKFINDQIRKLNRKMVNILRNFIIEKSGERPKEESVTF